MFVKMSKNLKERLKISSLAIPFMLLAIYLSRFLFFMPFFTLAIAGIIAVALWEFYRLAESKGFHPLSLLGIGSTLCYAFAQLFQSHLPGTLFLPPLILGLTLFFGFLYTCFKGSSPLVTLALTFFGILYLTAPLSYMISINFFFAPGDTQDGRWWLLYLLATAKLTDTGAFICGKLCGKSPMAPMISPKKTWEGALGGLLAGVATSLGFYLILNALYSPAPMALSLSQSLWLGAILSIVAQFGDLAESLLKRDAGVKDSYHLPGLGGVLDIVDSLVFTAPLLYLYMFISFN